MAYDIMKLRRNRGAVQENERAGEGRAELKYIDVGDLVPSEENFYPMSAIDELARLIVVAGGVKQPGLVTPLGGGKYKVLSGHRRRLASMRLAEQGMEEYRKMPCMVEEMPLGDGDDAEELREIDEAILLIATNGQREKTDWVKVEEVTRLRELLDRKRRHEKVEGQTRKIIAEQLGTTPAQVGRYESIGKHLIPDFKREMQAEKVNISVGYELSTLSVQDQMFMLEKYREKGSLTLEDVRRRKEKTDRPEPAPQKEPVEAAEIKPPVQEADAITPPPEPEPPAGKIIDFKQPEPGREPKEETPPPERMSAKRAARVLEDLEMYCEDMMGADGEKPETWEEYADALTVAIEALKK